jgi:hypothetical protein
MPSVVHAPHTPLLTAATTVTLGTGATASPLGAGLQ